MKKRTLISKLRELRNAEVEEKDLALVNGGIKTITQDDTGAVIVKEDDPPPP